MRFKPYIKKPIVHSPRGETILANVSGYLIQTASSEARTTDPGQALAALLALKKQDRRCLIHALTMIGEEEARELVDEEFLMEQMEKRQWKS